MSESLLKYIKDEGIDSLKEDFEEEFNMLVEDDSKNGKAEDADVFATISSFCDDNKLQAPSKEEIEEFKKNSEGLKDGKLELPAFLSYLKIGMKAVAHKNGIN